MRFPLASLLDAGLRAVLTAPARRSRTREWAALCFATLALLNSAGALGALIEDEEEQADLAKLPPEQLAKRVCTMCHQYPDPSMLTKKNWREQILPRMSVELGIFPPDYS